MDYLYIIFAIIIGYVGYFFYTKHSIESFNPVPEEPVDENRGYLTY